MKTDRSLIDLQINLLASLKRRLREMKGTEPKSLKNYYHDYEITLKDQKPIILSYPELLKRIRKNRVILVGDFHTLDQAQKVALDLLKAFISKGENTAIGVEAVHAVHQRNVNDYLNGVINEDELIKKIHYYSEWGFPWSNYAPIFRYARDKQIPVITLNRDGALPVRDKFMAKKITSFLKDYPENVHLIALIGDLHLAPNHLPQKIVEKSNVVPSVIFQNSESVYMDRLKEGKVPNGYFHLRENLYLINRVPPWVKLQTWLTFIEHGKSMMQDSMGKNKSLQTEEDSDSWEWLYGYVKVLKDFFSLRFRPDDTFRLYTMRDLDFLKGEYFKCHDGAAYKNIIQHGQSLFIPRGEIIYLPMLDINHAVQEATHYLMGYPLNLNPNQTALFMRIHYYSSGYIGSKIINPSRKTPSIGEMKNFLRAFERIRDKKDKAYLNEKKCVYENAIRFFPWIKKPEPLPIIETRQLYEMDTSHHFSISQQIGRIIGEHLFMEYQSGKVTREDLRSYIFERVNPLYLCTIPEIGE